MAERSNTGLVLLALGGLYLLSKPKSAGSSLPVASGSAGPAPADAGAGSTSTSKGSSWSDALKAGAGFVKTGGALAGAVATAAGVSAPAVVGAGLFIAAGAGVGYVLDGPVGAVVGGLNPITGDAALLGADGGKAVAGALGFNDAGTAASEASGAVLGGLATLADIATVAALLPTIAIAVLFADLLGAIFGSDPPTPPTMEDQIQSLFQIARSDPALSFLPLVAQDRINAAAQLVALSNGPVVSPKGLYLGGQFVATGGTQVNPYRNYARAFATQLGLSPLFDDAPPPSTGVVGSPKHGGR